MPCPLLDVSVSCTYRDVNMDVREGTHCSRTSHNAAHGYHGEVGGSGEAGRQSSNRLHCVRHKLSHGPTQPDAEAAAYAKQRSDTGTVAHTGRGPCSRAIPGGYSCSAAQN